MVLSIKLDERDNVTTVTEMASAGQLVRILTNQGKETECVKAKAEIPAFHKSALTDVSAGADVVKYGEVIGRASTPISRGEWVHVHNLESADLPEDLGSQGGSR